MMIFRVGSRINRHMGLYGLGAIVLGIAFGEVIQLPELKFVIPLGLFFMLYPMMLDIELEEVRRVVERPGLLGLSLVLNFIASPMLMYGLGWLFLGETYPMLLVGLVVFSLIPCGPMVPAFTGMAGGKREPGGFHPDGEPSSVYRGRARVFQVAFGARGPRAAPVYIQVSRDDRPRAPWPLRC